MMTIKKKVLILAVIVLVIVLLCAIVYFTCRDTVESITDFLKIEKSENENTHDKSAIEKAVEKTGDYYDWDLVYDKDTDILKIVLFPHMTSAEYKKITDVFEDCIKQDDKYKNYKKIEIIFADHNSKKSQFIVKNFEDDGIIRDHFDIVKVGSKIEGYNFDVNIPEGEYIRGFKRLEIGENDLKETKWIVFHFRDLEMVSCHLNEEDYAELNEFFSDIMPNCKIINLQ